LHIYFHPSLECTFVQNNTQEIFILGDILNPLNPTQTNQEIINNLSNIIKSAKYEWH
jgi:hypothetical protein